MLQTPSLTLMLTQAEDSKARNVQVMPYDMLNASIQSVRGAFTVMRDHLQPIAKERKEKKKYTVATSDVAIYSMFVRFIYNEQDFFPIVKQNAGIIFAIWHVWSIAMRSVWTRHMHTIIGPAYFAVFQGASERVWHKTTLTTQTAFLTDLMIAYGRIRNPFRMLFEREKKNSAVMHFHLFFEYLVPVVRMLAMPHLQCYIVCDESISLLLVVK